VATLPRRSVLRALREAPRRCPGFALLGNVRRSRGLRIPRDERHEALRDFEGEGGWIHGR